MSRMITIHKLQYIVIPNRLKLTPLPLPVKMAAISQMTISNVFSWMKRFDFFVKISL